MASKNKKLTKSWFIHVRGSYLPKSYQGWLSYITYVAYLLITLFYTKGLQYSVKVRGYYLIVQWVCAGLIMTWFAKRHS